MFGTPRQPELGRQAKAASMARSIDGAKRSLRQVEDEGAGLGVPVEIHQHEEVVLEGQADCAEAPTDAFDDSMPVFVRRKELGSEQKKELAKRIAADKERQRRKQRLGGEGTLLETY